MKEYDEATLKKVQQTEMEILRDFIKVCDENNLTWFGDAGSGIGAIRHKGFIPWDDDIDVMLPRKDFDKMIEVIKRDYSDKYSIANVETMKNYPLMTTRIMMKGTTFIEEPLKNIKCDLGIFLDVYPLDNISDDEEELKKLEDAIAFRNVSNMPARVKCALLAWHTIEDMLNKNDSTGTGNINCCQ